MALEDILQTMFYNNTVLDYLTALLAFVVAIIILKIIKVVVISRMKKLAEKTKNNIDDIIVAILDTINWPFYVYFAFYIGTRFLTLRPLIIEQILSVFLIVILVYYAGRAVQKLIDQFIEIHIEKRKDEARRSILRTYGILLKIIIWFVAILLVLSNLGVEITPLIAGLGIGGIAIAFALQNVLEDLFSSFSIYLDKPFKEGDFIIIGTDMGTIKHIGLKSTRIEALQGQEIVVSNRELTSIRINNYKKMEKRRIVFSFGVEYGTPISKLRKIPEIVKKVVSKVEHAEVDRVHFNEFGNFSLNYEVVYYVDVPDYNAYMDTRQEINFGLKEAFSKEKIEFAYPTQTIHLEK